MSMGQNNYAKSLTAAGEGGIGQAGL